MDTSTGLITLITAVKMTPEEESTALRLFCGKLLIQHGLELSNKCAEVVKTYVVTDSMAIEQKLDSIPSAAVVKINDSDDPSEGYGRRIHHWVNLIEKKEGETFRFVLVLSPFHPFLKEVNIMECFQRVVINAEAAGIRSVAKEPSKEYLPVSSESEYMTPATQATPVEHLRYPNDTLVLYRREALAALTEGEMESFMMPYELPERSAFPLDSEQNIERLKSLVSHPCTFLD